MNNSFNYYEILGVNKTASKEEIKKAYKDQMKKWHPDINKNKNASAMSKKIIEAKEVLLDDEKRKEYDESLNRKINDEYNKYTNKNYEQKEEVNEEKVTKWTVLSDYLNNSKDSFLRKIIAIIGVLVESLLCFIIKYLIIIISFICFILSDLIIEFFNYLLIPIILIFLLSIFKYLKDVNIEDLKISIIIISLFISAYLLPLIGNILLSKKVFYFLYNDIDINLFKICIGYNKK